LVLSVLTDQDEGRQKDCAERHTHRQHREGRIVEFEV
jgi:hypothetical protein